MNQADAKRNTPLPSIVRIITADGEVAAAMTKTGAATGGVNVEWVAGDQGLNIYIESPTVESYGVRLRFPVRPAVGVRCLGDHWERGYGDLEWRGIVPERPLPWYGFLTSSAGTLGFGVKTTANAFACWHVDSEGIGLTLDIRNGGRGVRLGGRRLLAATIVWADYSADVSPFDAAFDFCKRLCDRPRLPNHIVYGGNNWYSAYGISSDADMMRDTELIAELTEGLDNRPYMVVDDCWQPADGRHPEIGPGWAGGYDWRRGNDKFPDMPGLADRMRRLGVRPGIWLRPLAADSSGDPSTLLSKNRILLPDDNLLKRAFLDPTTGSAQEKIRGDIKMLADWGYELIKHDFSTWDLFGRWGFEMGESVTGGDWSFSDRTKTNAEIVRNLYELIRDAAGDAVIIGCNTVSHLSAGLFEIQKIGRAHV